ncbi:beta-ketoacyl-ACP synthase III [Bdellovibrio bacteriovorus]|uniref:Beta-ketoacyl-[acyl-carrier-protein] synthase III n=1 Tax=Bdellovibrio bacteriovorus TaxID=959 RepID=A0A150WE27_BDEBC|nr:beta-ketoacyl-ACP synthase III [Bdellovibrio bacteriovorus]KYG61223.1 3-oxoacyl-ACP synthase [Bdellovibrio bacteriovorus]
MAGMYRSRVSGIGSYLPEKILSNKDLEKMVETNDQWIVERTGIERRHIASEDQATSDLCVIAAKRALEDANLKIEDIDMILVGTVTGDHQMPSTAAFVQAKLGAKNIMAVDLNAACSGFLYGISIADQFIRTGMYKNVLVIGAEVLSRYMNYKDRETCILFGDGAGAWVLSRAAEGDKNVIESSHLHADGTLAELLILPAGGSRIPQSHEAIDKGLNFMTMKGREIFKNAVRTMALCCQEALEHNKVSPEQVDWIVPHQANKRIIEAVADQFKFPMERVIVYLQETGNTSAASIPLAFDWAVKNGKIKRGQTILLTAFGAGLTSGSILLRY